MYVTPGAARRAGHGSHSLLLMEVDPKTIGERHHRFGESEALCRHHETKHIAADAAAEAMVDPVNRVDREGRRDLIVERAEACRLGPVRFEVAVGAYDRDDVGGIPDRVDVIGGEVLHQKDFVRWIVR